MPNQVHSPSLVRLELVGGPEDGTVEFFSHQWLAHRGAKAGQPVTLYAGSGVGRVRRYSTNTPYLGSEPCLRLEYGGPGPLVDRLGRLSRRSL